MVYSWRCHKNKITLPQLGCPSLPLRPPSMLHEDDVECLSDATISKDAGLELRQVYHLALFVFNMHRIAPN